MTIGVQASTAPSARVGGRDGAPRAAAGVRGVARSKEMTHFLSMLLFAGFVSLIFAVLMKDEPPEQAKLGGILFASFVTTALVVGWLLFPFPL